jgi:GT2 family glycosyltransferase/glycosyltransferase involved in cell wall biosynthesis
MAKIIIVTPVLNNLFYTKLFLKSLERQTFKDFSVVIVDNGSTDGTREWISDTYLRDKCAVDDTGHMSITPHNISLGLVLNKENRGYAGGCNDGISIARKYYPDADVLVTNNDMELYPNCIEELVNFADKNRANKIGILGGRLLFPDGRIQHGGAFINVYGWGQHKLAGVMDKDFVEVTPEEQEYVTGALFYITKECLHVMQQGFDELFNPAYFEEVDFCTTARKHGYRTFYIPTAKAIHYENKTSNEVFGSADKVSNLSRSQQQKFYIKHDNSASEYIPTSDKKALITGKIYGDWSFSIVLRNLAKGLKRNGVDVSIAPEEYHQPGNMDDWEIQEMIKKPNDYWNRVVLRSSEGDHQYLMPPGIKRIAHTTFEGTRPHKGWVDQLNHVDHVVTNSSFCKNNLIERGVKTPIAIIPNPIDTTIFNPNNEPLGIEKRRSFGFLMMGAYGERKSVELALRAFISEFKPDEDVFFSVHMLSLFFILQQQGLTPQMWLRNNVLGGKDLPHAPIYLTSNSFLPIMVPKMITAHQCFVMPSRCEGFGNGIIEAAACGLPSIATNYSGMTDFISEEVGYPLSYKLEDMPLQVLPYFRNYIGSQWALPDFEHLRALMRYAFSHQEETKQRGRKAYQKALDYDIKVVGKNLSQVMFDKE